MARKSPPEPLPLPDRGLLDEAFVPYAQEIGFLLREWNDMQEKFSDLFATLLKHKNGGVAGAIWHAVPNDRLQRAMLLGTAKQQFPNAGTDQQKETNKAVLDEIEWLINSANNLGPSRDAVAHAPVTLVLNDTVEYIAHWLRGHPLATKLKDKKLLKEITHYRQCAFTIWDHCRNLDEWLRHGGTWTFPQRPAWPERRKSSEDQPRTNGRGSSRRRGSSGQ